MDYEAVLFANEAFYRAFASRDLEAMQALWASHRPVACVHPGWGVLTDRDAIIESWRGILASANAPEISCREARAFLIGDVAFVICFEAIDGGFLIATNIFAREDGRWKIVHHQAGPTAEQPEDGGEPEAVVH
ncbi:nuclear transport factor 2 family protein [Rhodospirillaceae bacterium SYSU D60014]|uniref:nuclear transport factor 2 family protein n=1 Tax=Virgifigura deserti TaxID=2268457 RepID=UPI000E672F2B